jgi:hypothetical protein
VSGSLADVDLITWLGLNEYAGSAYDRFAEELAKYGYAVMFAWIRKGIIFSRCRKRGFGGLFSKGWPQYELDGLVTLQLSGEQNLLPIWHEITKDEVMTTSPSLADKIARSTAQHTIEEIATEIASVVRPDLALAATAWE